MTDKLALFGGSPIIKFKFNRYNSIGKDEIRAVNKVMKTGVLSDYLGVWGKNFFGGPKVQQFENICKKFFKVKHAIAVNSWTSGLTTAVGAIDIEPGDEIIVSPWTMSATATSILHWNAIPVFADIEPNTFCLDPQSVEKAITPYTKAIMSVDIFGQSADMDSLLKIAKRHNLKIISDAAQSPGSYYKKKYTGTLADIGGFSFNYHKHINTGEGGILVTNSDKLANRMRLIRNHAEAVVKDKGESNLTNMVGHNYRMGEIEAAIGIEQLKKLKKIVLKRQKMINKLSNGIKNLKGIQIPQIRKYCTHSFYSYPILINSKLLKVSRKKICKALLKEGVPGLGLGYTNLHLLPMYQKKIAFGSKGFPWTIAHSKISYKKGICPVAERLHDFDLFNVVLCLYEYGSKEVNGVIKAFNKVWKNLNHLK